MKKYFFLLLITLILSTTNVSALTCTTVGENGATTSAMWVDSTTPGNVAGYVYYKSLSSDNGYITFICDTTSGPSQSTDLLYQNVIVQGVHGGIKGVTTFAGFGNFSSVVKPVEDFFPQLVGNYDFGFGFGSSGYNVDNGFVYGFSAISSAPATISFRVFVPNTSDLSGTNQNGLISFYTYDKSFDFIQGGPATNITNIINNYNSSSDNYNTNKITDSIDDVNDTINDDNTTGATADASDFFTNFTTNTHGLTGIITAPLNAISSLTSSTCSPLVLPLPFVDEDLELPCMRSIYEQYFGNFMTLYDVVVIGILSYWVLVKIFALVKDFKNPQHDEVEVMDL